MKRRDFLRSTSAIGLPIMVNGFGLNAIPRNSLTGNLAQSDKVLVLIQLNGGNDGINSIIPIEHYDNLSKYRSNILIPESQVLKIDEKTGFHPAMSAMKGMFDDGKMGIVQAVAYPNQNRSHFRSTDIWSSGSHANEFLDTGWLGRFFTNDHPGYPSEYPNPENPDPFAITIGSVVSETCQGVGGNFSLALNNPADLAPIEEGENGTLPDTNYGTELGFLIEAIKQTNAYSETILQAADLGSNLSTAYPDNNRLAQTLKTVALLISGGLKTNVYVVTLGGFDTHANQTGANSPVEGQHAGLMSTLSDAVFAFQDDLAKLGLEERVLGMTFSEFGRQIGSNDSFGTDHGTAAPLMLFGSCVKPGMMGTNPEIGDQIEQGEGVAMQFDFRSVYASVLMDWFDVSESDVQDIFFDGVQYLPVIEGCTSTSIFDSSESLINVGLFPNPTSDHATFEFGVSKGVYRISLFDYMGHELRVITEKSFSMGSHRMNIDVRSLPPGSYYVRIQGKSVNAVKKLVKS